MILGCYSDIDTRTLVHYFFDYAERCTCGGRELRGWARF